MTRSDLKFDKKNKSDARLNVDVQNFFDGTRACYSFFVEDFVIQIAARRKMLVCQELSRSRSDCNRKSEWKGAENVFRVFIELIGVTPTLINWYKCFLADADVKLLNRRLKFFQIQVQIRFWSNWNVMLDGRTLK